MKLATLLTIISLLVPQFLPYQIGTSSIPADSKGIISDILRLALNAVSPQFQPSDSLTAALFRILFWSADLLDAVLKAILVKKATM